MGIQEAITELEDVDAKEFAEALQEQSPAHYKAIYTPAFGAGKTSVQDDLQEKETKLETLQGERDKLQKKIEDLEGEQPEVAEIRGRYESKLEDLQSQIQAKDEEIKTIQTDNTQTLRQKEQQFFQERAKNALLPHVEDPDIADIKIMKAIQDGRVQFDDDLQPKVYEEDGEVPTPLGDKQPHEVFAESLLQSIPDKFLKDRRASSVGNPGGGGGKNTISRAQFEKLSPAEKKAHVQDGGEVTD